MKSSRASCSQVLSSPPSSSSSCWQCRPNCVRIKHFELRRHVKTLFQFIKALFRAGKTSAGHACQFVDALSDFAAYVFFGCQRSKFFCEDLLEAFLGELIHRCEVNGEGDHAPLLIAPKDD